MGNRAVLATAIAIVSAAEGPAQVGDGWWKEYFPEVTIQERGPGATYTKADGIETFRTAPGDERCEARVMDDYRSGIRQFEGYVNVTSGEGTCVHQVFKFLMIVAYARNGGELRQHSSMSLGTTGAYNRWIRINTIHDADRKTAEVWVDGEKKLAFPAGGDRGGPNGWYHKYGVYNGSQVRPQSQWKAIRYWEKSISPLTLAPVAARTPEAASLAIFNLKGELLWQAPGKAHPRLAVGIHPAIAK